jgi:hypothetical protein
MIYFSHLLIFDNISRSRYCFVGHSNKWGWFYINCYCLRVLVINSDSNILVIIENRDIKLAQTFNNSSVCYKDDTLSLHNSGFGEYLDPIYPSKIEENDTTDTQISASYINLYIEIEYKGRLKTKASTGITLSVSYKIQELLTLREHLYSASCFGGVRVAHRIRFLCCVSLFCLSSSCVLYE